jgi:hypothetical protein
MGQDGQPPEPEQRPGVGGSASQAGIEIPGPLVAQLRTPRSAGVAGIIFAVLMVVSVLLIQEPGANLSDAAVTAWFQKTASSSLPIVGMYLIPLAGIAFLWFIAVIRSRIGQQEDRFFGTVFLATGIIFTALLFAGAAVAGSLMAGARFFGWVNPPGPEVIRTVRMMSYVFIYVYAAKMAGAFVIVCNTIVLRTKIFSRWVAVLGYVIGLFLLFNVGLSAYAPLATLFPAWVTFLSVYMLFTSGKPGRRPR